MEFVKATWQRSQMRNIQPLHFEQDSAPRCDCRQDKEEQFGCQSPSKTPLLFLSTTYLHQWQALKLIRYHWVSDACHLQSCLLPAFHKHSTWPNHLRSPRKEYIHQVSKACSLRLFLCQNW